MLLRTLHAEFKVPYTFAFGITFFLDEENCERKQVLVTVQGCTRY